MGILLFIILFLVGCYGNPNKPLVANQQFGYESCQQGLHFGSDALPCMLSILSGVLCDYKLRLAFE
jgi:hypothetical protein